MKKMKKMDILQIARMLAIIGSILLSLAIVLSIFTDFLVKKPKKEEQKIESDVYGFYKDGKWIKYEELVVGEKELVNNKHWSGNVGIGTEAVKSFSYKPIKLEEWQIIQIKDAKEKGFAGVEMTINNNQTYISFHNTSNQSQ